MADECYVLLHFDAEDHPFVLVSDAPDAPMTVGAQQTRSFAYTRNGGWPDEAQAYAQKLSQANGNAPVDYEWFDCPIAFDEF